MSQTNLQRWQQFVETKDPAVLQEILHRDVEFHSPTLWKPKVGRSITAYILQMLVDMVEDFTYHRTWDDGESLALEFSATVDGKALKGIDLIRWNDEGQIVHFEVMIRPINTLQLIFEKMTARLQEAGFLPKNLA